MSDFYRGHLIETGPAGWIYSDTGLPVAGNTERPCGLCGLSRTKEGHDGCLGTVHGVVNACCGHGQVAEAFVQLTSGVRLAAMEAVCFLVRGRQEDHHERL